MSDYSRQIILTSALAAIVVIGIGLGVYIIQPQLSPVRTNSSIIQTTSSSYSQTFASTSYGSTNHTTPQGSSIANYVSGSTCRSSNNLNLVPGDLSRLAFLIYQNTTSEFCVSYTFEPTQTRQVVNFQEFASVFSVIATAVNGGFSYSKSPAPGVTMTANQSSITLDPSNSSTAVVIQYSIVASATAKGFFSLNYLDSCPAFIPFSVGYGTSQVNASDFHGFFLPSSCIIQGVPVSSIQVSGYSNMGTLLITAANETN